MAAVSVGATLRRTGQHASRRGGYPSPRMGYTAMHLHRRTSSGGHGNFGILLGGRRVLHGEASHRLGFARTFHAKAPRAQRRASPVHFPWRLGGRIVPAAPRSREEKAAAVLAVFACVARKLQRLNLALRAGPGGRGGGQAEEVPREGQRPSARDVRRTISLAPHVRQIFTATLDCANRKQARRS